MGTVDNASGWHKAIVTMLIDSEVPSRSIFNVEQLEWVNLNVLAPVICMDIYLDGCNTGILILMV
jgi:hypothetical protein